MAPAFLPLTSHIQHSQIPQHDLLVQYQADEQVPWIVASIRYACADGRRTAFASAALRSFPGWRPALSKTQLLSNDESLDEAIGE